MTRSSPSLRAGVRQATVPDLSVVVPAHNEEVNLRPLVTELLAESADARVRLEILLVDDGSTDSTLAVIRELVREHAAVRGLRLSRNFGHQAAVSVGLTHTCGRAVGVMDADLQDRPTDLIALYRRWLEGADVVYAIRASRKEPLLQRVAYRMFYRLLARIAAVPIPIDSGDFCVMSREFVDRLNRLPERQRYVRGLRAWLGGRQVGLAVARDARRAGEPKYTLLKLVRLATDGLVSFSHMPLRIASLVGFAVSVIAFGGAMVVLGWRFMGLLPSGAGLATIALSVLFLGGIQLMTIGILGEYVGRIFDEVKARPVAVVAEVVEPPAEE